MICKLYSFSSDNLDPEIFKPLLENRLFSPHGVLHGIYKDPIRYSFKGNHLGVLETEDGKPVSVCFAAKEEYFGWSDYMNLTDHYGMIGFYTSPDYRRQGLAAMLFDEFDDKFKLRKLCASKRARKILKKLTEDELTILEYA